MFIERRHSGRKVSRLYSLAPWALALCLMAAMLVQAGAAVAADPVGELEVARGRVKIWRQGGAVMVREGDPRAPLFQGDLLRSGKGARAEVYLREGKDTVSMYSATVFRIAEASNKGTRIGLGIGKAFVKVLSAFSQGRFKLQTPTAVIGVKGTEFVASTDGVETFLLTVSGVVGLANVDFPEQEILVRANQASSVMPGALPARPVEVPEETQEKIIEEDGSETIDEVETEIQEAEQDDEGKEPDEDGGEGTQDEESGEDNEDGDAQEDDVATDTGGNDEPSGDLSIITDTNSEVGTETEEARPSEDVGAPTIPIRLNIKR